MYYIKKASEISGVSVRTLQHYDDIGLLCPEKMENGYRYYSEVDMEKLQTILFYKYLGFSLKSIKAMLNFADKDILSHLKKQLKLMNKEKTHLLTLINTLEDTIDSKERKIYMTTNDKFKGFKYEYNEKYTNEAIEKYGDVVKESIKKHKGKEEEIAAGFNEIFFEFADNMEEGLISNNNKNIELAEKLHQHLIDTSFDCSLEVFSKIGFNYVNDPEFNSNMDKYRLGMAQYVCNAIQAYVRSK